MRYQRRPYIHALRPEKGSIPGSKFIGPIAVNCSESYWTDCMQVNVDVITWYSVLKFISHETAFQIQYI
jgi:hypothetical protein